MNNNPSAAKRWIIIILLLEDGVMEKCVTMSLRMTSIIMTPFYAIKEERLVNVRTKAENMRNSLKGQMLLKLELKNNGTCKVKDINRRREWDGKEGEKVQTITGRCTQRQEKKMQTEKPFTPSWIILRRWWACVHYVGQGGRLQLLT